MAGAPRLADVVVDRVLIVDDDPLARASLGRLLEQHGFECQLAADADQGRHRLKEQTFDLMLCDIQMPGESGMRLVAQTAEELVDMAIVMVTATDDPDVAEEALRLGADGYVVKPYTPNEILIGSKLALHRRELERHSRRQVAEYEDKLLERSDALRTAISRLGDAHPDPHGGATSELVELLSNALTLRHEETGRHIERVGRYATLLAEAADVDDWPLENLRRAAMLHDVGKIGLPDAVLTKRGPLTSEEFETVKHHSELGHRLLAGSDSPTIQLAATIALYHHERWDGSGYPAGLVGESIPLAARIVAIADEFDAIGSERVYRPAYSFDHAVGHLRQQGGMRHDPGLVETFLQQLPAVRQVREDLPDPEADEPIGVLIVDHHEMFAVSLARMLTEARMAVIGTVNTAGAALIAVREHCPDVVLLNWNLPDSSGATTTHQIRQLCETTQVVVLTGGNDVNLLEAVEAGCAGYLTKDRAVNEVIAAVRSAHDGEPVMPASKLASLVRRLRQHDGPHVGNPLTPRENEVLALLAQGLSNDAIAQQLVISLHTVRNHVQQIITKLEAHSKLEAVTTAVRRGIVTYPTS